MKFDVPRIVKRMRLSEYAAEFGETEIQVWVNPPAKLLQEHDRVLDEVREIMSSPPASDLTTEAQREEEFKKKIKEIAQELARIFSELWSQGPEGTRWTAEEIGALVEGTLETDPQLWPWLRNRTIGLIHEHRQGIKKN